MDINYNDTVGGLLIKDLDAVLLLQIGTFVIALVLLLRSL